MELSTSHDISLFSPCREIVTDTDRVYVSSGITASSRVNQLHHVPYAARTFVPLEPWRNLETTEDSSSIWQPRPAPTRNSGIAIVRLTQEYMIALRRAYLDLRRAHLDSSSCELDTAQAKEALERASADLLSDIRSLCRVKGEVVFSGVARHQANLSTATVNPTTGLYAGLHLDSWDRLPLDKRQDSTNRLCANIGTTDRFLLFIPCTLHRIRLRLESLEQSPVATPSSLVNRFLSAFPAEPVYRVRVRPHEAYIAPTENMIHDGSTAGSTGPTHCATFRGNIWFP